MRILVNINSRLCCGKSVLLVDLGGIEPPSNMPYFTTLPYGYNNSLILTLLTSTLSHSIYCFWLRWFLTFYNLTYSTWTRHNYFPVLRCVARFADGVVPQREFSLAMLCSFELFTCFNNRTRVWRLAFYCTFLTHCTTP